MAEALKIPYREEIRSKEVSKPLERVRLQLEHVNKGTVGTCRESTAGH